MPLVEPLDVEGLTFEQVRDAIRDTYIDEDILRPEKARPIVTIIKERTYDVIVVREDSTAFGTIKHRGEDVRREIHSWWQRPKCRRRLGQIARLPERHSARSGRDGWFARLEREERSQGSSCQPSGPTEASSVPAAVLRSTAGRDAGPLCLPTGTAGGSLDPEDSTASQAGCGSQTSREDDVRLKDGDIVYIESRETEVFYTGGLLQGGEFPLPRDYDLDVLGAMALPARASSPSAEAAAEGGGGGLGGGVQDCTTGNAVHLAKDSL